MNIKYLVSSLNGDIPLGPEDLARPFLITPSQAHPFLTLRDYFESVESFILKGQATSLISVLKERIKTDISLDDIEEILIRSEKHGALYHLAGIEILVAGKRVRLAVSTAVSEKAKGWLFEEYGVLNYLNHSFKPSYLPDVYFKWETDRQSGDARHETLAMIVTKWFKDYHEWHLSIDETDNKQKIRIWDQKHGHPYASDQEAFEIFSQAARILTLYYDPIHFRQIYPWHHAAGDFVVRARAGRVDVRLTTARRYRSIMDSFSAGPVNPMIAMTYFFLNLTVRMRLDKLDGVGKTVWADNPAIEAATEGFFDALGLMEAEGRYPLGQVEDLRSLIKSFDEKELETLFQSLCNLYEEDDPEDLAIIRKNLKSHVQDLYAVFHGFRKDLRP